VRFTEREIFSTAGMDKKQAGGKGGDSPRGNLIKVENQTLVKESNFKLKKNVTA
jgi:hypothetical protein